MMLICTSRLDIEEQEAKLLEKVFFHDEMEAAKEEKDEKLDDIEVEPISDTEEQETILNDGIELDKALSTEPEEQTSRLSANPSYHYQGILPGYVHRDGSGRVEMTISLSTISLLFSSMIKFSKLLSFTRPYKKP